MSDPFVHSEQEALAVARQLGREPRGRWRVARTCSCGDPQVIETHPRLDDGTPFPTTWWLTCRELCKEISRLESIGHISRFNRMLDENAPMRLRLLESTDAYLAYRDSVEVLDERDHPGGGEDHVKCLHAHVAHHLVRNDNPIGEIILGEIYWNDPEVPCA